MEYPILSQNPYVEFRHVVAGFLTELIKPRAIEWEKSRYFPAELLKEFGDRGYLGLSLPKESGGQGKSFWHEVVLAEELAKCGTLGWSLSVLAQTSMLSPLLHELGTEEQKEKVLRPALSGDFYLALAATDIESGSDLVNTKTRAEKKGGGYVLLGEKRYITNGSVAKYIVTLARTANEEGIWSLSLFLVPGDAQGVERERLQTMGMKTGDTAAIIFNKCKVSQSNILGKPDKGFYYLLKSLHHERLVGAIALNELTSHVLEQTIKFLKDRNRFGEPLMNKQAIRHTVAEMSSQLEASRQFTYATCDAFSRSENVDKEIIMLKAWSYGACSEIIRKCIHFHGAEAFLETHWLSHVYSDLPAFTLAAGSSEVMKDLLSGML